MLVLDKIGIALPHSTGNHLHLEMKVNNVLVNVMNYLS